MFAAALRTTALVVAILAAWLVVGNAAYAVSAVQQPCHAAYAEMQASKALLAHINAVQAEGNHHRNDGGDHNQRPTGGMCCDAFCHAVMLAFEQDMTGAEAHYAFYGMVADEGLFSHTVHGLDRPPRHLAL